MNETPERQAVRIVDIDMPIGSMTSFMVKWVIASIPAFLILGLIAFLATALFFVFSVAV